MSLGGFATASFDVFEKASVIPGSIHNAHTMQRISIGSTAVEDFRRGVGRPETQCTSSIDEAIPGIAGRLPEQPDHTAAKRLNGPVRS